MSKKGREKKRMTERERGVGRVRETDMIKGGDGKADLIDQSAAGIQNGN